MLLPQQYLSSLIQRNNKQHTNYKGTVKLADFFLYYWSYLHETAHVYVEPTFRNILFVAIFRFSS